MLEDVQNVPKLSIYYGLAVPVLVVFGDEVSVGVSQVRSSEKWVKSKA